MCSDGDAHLGTDADFDSLKKLTFSRLPIILMYHSIADETDDPHRLCVTPERFAQHMWWLRERNLRGVAISTLVDAMRAGRERGLVGITFDDGYTTVIDNALPELQRHEFTATVFVISRLLGGTNEWDTGPEWPLMSAEQVGATAASGLEIGSHSATHVRLASISGDRERLQSELAESKVHLADVAGGPIRGFAYPWGNMNAAVRHATEDAGYDYACSVETPVASLGIMALPRIVFSQHDGPVRMAAKQTFFKSYTLTRGVRRSASGSPMAQPVKRQLARMHGHS